MSERIRSNFLLVEFDEGSKNKEVVEHDIQLENNKVIRINKIKTEDYSSIYKALGNLELSVSALDIRKVQNVVKDIYKGGKTRVEITEDIDDLNNSEKILAIGTSKTIKYEFQIVPELMQKYFQTEEEENKQILDVINKQIIQKNQFFPIYCFRRLKKHLLEFENKNNTSYKKLLCAYDLKKYSSNGVMDNV